jgi:thiol:disulfide interchange protein DsbD
MAFPLLATVIWLLWVVGLQAGLVGVISALAGLLVAGLAGWLYGRWPTGVMRIVAGALVIGGIALGVAGMRKGAPVTGTAEAGGWEPYSKARLEKALAGGNPVFVDFTAAWCLTCKANELAVLDTEGIRAAFRRHKVVLLRGDWTNPDPEIERALAEFGRNGVPLYLLYSGKPGAPPGVLPQILTPNAVIARLDGLPRRD